MDSQNGQGPGEHHTDIADMEGSLLVVGTVPDDRFGGVIQWVLGQSETPTRNHIIVTTSGVDPDVESHLASAVEPQRPESYRIIYLT